jgi:hypothetical protein
MKQETLEEFKKRFSNDKSNKDINLDYQDGIFYGIEIGSKWQQEQDKKRYSEEEVIYFAKWCAEMKVYDHETYVYNTFETLLEKFKNR